MGYAQDYANASSQILENLGRSQAQGILGAGQAWGQALGNVGQAIAAVPQQIAQQKQVGLQGQLTQAQIADFQAQAADRQRQVSRANGYASALAATTPQYVTPNPAGGYTPDDQGLANDLTQQGFGPEAQSYLKDAADLRQKAGAIQTAQDTHQAAVQTHNDTQADRVADLVDGLSSPTAGVNALHAAVMAGALDPEAAGKIAAWITSAPGAWEQTKATLLQASPARQKEAAALREKMNTPQLVTTAPGAQSSFVTPGQTTPGQPVQSGGQELESKPVMINGQQGLANFNKFTGKYTDPTSGADISSRVTPVPTQAVVNLNQAAAGPLQITPGSRDDRSAHDLADGALTLAQLKTIYPYTRDGSNQQKIAAIYDAARQLNPNFNPADFEAGFKFATNPKVRQQVASLNNVESGVSDLLKFSDAADRTGVPLVNQAILPGGVKLGSKSYANVATARTAFADELSGALGYGSATDMSREMGLDMTDPNMSGPVFRSNIQDVVVPFVARKKAALLGQMGPYGAAGSAEGGPALPPASHFAGMKAGTYDVTGPDGKTVRVIWDGTTVKGGG